MLHLLHCDLLGLAAEDERRSWENKEKRGEENEKKKERGMKNVNEEERQSRLRAVLSQVEDQVSCSFCYQSPFHF